MTTITHNIQKKFAIYFLFFLFSICNIFAHPPHKEFIILRCRQAGMFSIFNDVLSLLDCYERGLFSGIEVDFAESGLYYDPHYGSNWWRYYCQPISIGNKSKAKVREVLGTQIPYAISRVDLRAYNRKKAYDLIQKYIHLKPTLGRKIDLFAKHHFDNVFVIGVHYRGTDKVAEAPRVPYHEVAEKVTEEIANLNLSHYKIFVATDEIGFLDYMSSLFPNKICYYEDIIRSEDRTPVHHNAEDDQYKRGEGAIIDCLLLSKTNLLIRTSSSLSLWSTYFNPYLSVIELNQRYEP